MECVEKFLVCVEKLSPNFNRGRVCAFTKISQKKNCTLQSVKIEKNDIFFHTKKIIKKLNTKEKNIFFQF
jgi:hypothetical protein